MDRSVRFRFDDKMNYDLHPKSRGRMDLGVALFDMEQAQLIRPVPDEESVYLFTHALLQDTAYSTLLKQERKNLHRAVAETLQYAYADRLDDYAALLTLHFREATMDEETVEYGIRGDAAMRLYATTEARLLYGHALDALACLPDNDENSRRRMDTLAKQVIASRFSDSPTQNLARLDEAKALAERLLASDPSVRRQLAQIYHWKGFINLIQNHGREALGYFNDSSAQAQVLGDDQLVAINLVHAAAVLNFQGRFGEAEPLLRNSMNLLSKVGNPTEELYILAQLGLSLANQGSYAEGLAQAQRGLTLALDGNHTGGIEACYTILGQIYRLGDDFARMLEAGRAVVTAAQAAQDIVFVCGGSFLIAWAQSYLGQHQAAFETSAMARGLLELLRGQVPSRELYAAAEAEIALNAGQAGEAKKLAEQAVNLAHSVDGIFAKGLAHRVWGQALAQTDPPSWEQAETHLAESLRLFEQGNARLEAARTHRVWGSLLSRGNRDAGNEHLAKAEAQFHISGIAAASID